MEKSGKKSILSTINEKARKVRRSRYSIPIYVLTVFLASFWLIFFGPCMMNILFPILVILIPYKLYDENNLKKLAVTGIVAIILLSFTMASYHAVIQYDRPRSREVGSEIGNLENGTVEPIWGDSTTKFNLTVEVNYSENYTVYANLTHAENLGFRRVDYEGYEMKKVNASEHANKTKEYYVIVDELPEKEFAHYFSLKKNISLEEDDYAWERSDLGFGPVTLERQTYITFFMARRSLNTSVIYFLIIGLLWLKRYMDRSVAESVEGLEEKEEELEDYCPECGHLLEGKKECDRCGWIKEPEDEMYDDEGEPD